MEIRRLTTGELADFSNLISIFKEVFESAAAIPNAHHLAKLLSDQGFMAFVVKINGRVVGGLTLYVLNQYYSARPLAYIYDVGIAQGFQGKGLGQALLSEVCNFCKASGFEAAYVQAESEDVDAVKFYRKTEFSEETPATHFTYRFH